MKTSIKILFLLSCVLIFSACANPFKKTEQQTVEKERIYTCDSLKNETVKQDCVQIMSDVVIEKLNSEIINTFDAKRCVELPQEMADICVKEIKESGVIGPISNEQFLALQEAMDLSVRVIEPANEGDEPSEKEYYDISKCSALTVQGLKEYCEKKLNESIEAQLVNEIINSGDSARCDELKTDKYNEICKIELNIVPEESETIQKEAAEPTK